MELHERVKKRRLELGLTQEELAKRMGYSSRVSVNKIEMGRPISQKIISKLAKALNVKESYLMGWDDDNNSNNNIISELNLSNEDIKFILKFKNCTSDCKKTIEYAFKMDDTIQKYQNKMRDFYE